MGVGVGVDVVASAVGAALSRGGFGGSVLPGGGLSGRSPGVPSAM